MLLLFMPLNFIEKVRESLNYSDLSNLVPPTYRSDGCEAYLRAMASDNFRILEDGDMRILPSSTGRVGQILKTLAGYHMFGHEIACDEAHLDIGLRQMIGKCIGGDNEDARVVASDVADLVRAFVLLEGIERVRIRLETVFTFANEPSTFAGAGFHRDQISTRLLRTYVGPGFEWIEEGKVDSHAFDRYHRSGIELDFVDPREIRCINEGDIVIFRANKVIHRRPNSPGPRVLLTVDPL